MTKFFMIEGTGSGIRIRGFTWIRIRSRKNKGSGLSISDLIRNPASSPNDRPAAGQMEVTLLILIYMHLYSSC